MTRSGQDGFTSIYLDSAQQLSRSFSAAVLLAGIQSTMPGRRRWSKNPWRRAAPAAARFKMTTRVCREALPAPARADTGCAVTGALFQTIGVVLVAGIA